MIANVYKALKFSSWLQNSFRTCDENRSIKFYLIELASDSP